MANSNDQLWPFPPLLSAFGDQVGIIRFRSTIDGIAHDVRFEIERAEFSILPPVIPGDLDGDGDVDRNDMNLILAARNTPASGPDDPRDLNGDGMITLLDARTLTAFCTRARCATE